MKQITNKDKHLGWEALALGIAFVWGTTFIVQKTVMEFTGPWMFTGMRFSLAVPVLLVMVLILERQYFAKNWRLVALYSFLPGAILATASMMQQVALQSTYASKAGLITCLYVSILPFVSVFFGYRLKLREVVAAFMSLTGLYFLSVTSSFSMTFGDFLLVLSAFGWMAHIMSLELSLRHIKPFSLALCQTTVCAMMVNITVPFVEMESVVALANDFTGIISNIWFDLLYGGIMSVGFAFGLQVLAQQHLSPNRVGLLFSMESLFAVIFGWLLLSETFNQRELLGVILMLASLFVVRLQLSKRQTT